jgi:transglutaminase-like putative cysteine protease
VRTSRHFQFTYVVKVPAIAGRGDTTGRVLRLWAPLPQGDRYQRISDPRIISPVPYRVGHAADGNLDAYIVLRGRQLRNPAEIRIQFDVLRRERVVRLPAAASGPAAEGEWAGDPPGCRESARSGRQAHAELAPYRKPNRMIPLDGIIAQLSTQTTQGNADPLEKARKIYEYVVAHMRYDKTGTDWGRGDAVWACSSHRGNCTDFHSLFIGMARAAGIPA